MKLLILSSIILVSQWSVASTLNKTFSAKSVRYIKVKNQNGFIKVVKSDNDLINAEFEKVKFKNCNIEQELKSRKLEFEVEKNGMFKNSDCEVNITLKVPESMGIYLKSGTGNITVENRSESVKVKTGTGSIQLSGLTNIVEANAGSGSINVEGKFTNAKLYSGSGNITAAYTEVPLGSQMSVKVGSGSVTLSFAQAPVKGELEIKTGTGTVDVSMPKGSKFKSEIKTGTGNIKNQFKSVANSSYSVVIKAGTGNVNLLAK